MLAWMTENLSTLVVGALVLGVTGVSLRATIRSLRSGKCAGCSGGCSHCSGSGSCHCSR